MIEEARVVLADIDVPDVEQLDGYLGVGGYAALVQVRSQGRPDAVLEELRQSGLRDREAEWEPLTAQWDSGGCQSLCVLAHEADFGLFRTRKLIERNPHQLVEGMALAAFALGASVVHVCLRDTMRQAQRLLQQALREARRHGLLAARGEGNARVPEIHLHTSPAGHVGGMPSAAIHGLEGQRPEPSALPPRRLFGASVAMARAATLAYVPWILRHGVAWFRDRGTQAYPGTCVCCISGHVRRPGLYEVALGGGTLEALIQDCAGGVRRGHELQAVAVGGIHGTVLRADELDVALDPRQWAVPGGGRFAASLGAASLVVMDETTCMVEVAAELLRYCARESCGQCPSCRVGSAHLARLFARLETGGGTAEDIREAAGTATQMAPMGRTASTALCGLATAAAWQARGLLQRFAAEFQAHVRATGCPVRKDRTIKVPETVSVRY